MKRAKSPSNNMPTLHVAFANPLTNITAADCKIAVRDAAANDATRDESSANTNQQTTEALQAIARQLSNLEIAKSDLMRQTSEQIAQAAAEIARAVLRDPELVQDRAVKFVELGVEQIDSNNDKIAWVHPSCVFTIQQWLEQADIRSLTVAGDDSVDPGDCRIDCGDTGVSATLDAYFDCIRNQSQSTL